MAWDQDTVDVDAAAAFVIAAGMRAVAEADGVVRPSELALIEAFERGLPEPPATLQAKLGDPLVVDSYLRSLVMVALADGQISPVEHDVIVKLAEAQGIGIGDLERVIYDVKRTFLDFFDGVTVFSDARRQIAAELGLDV